MTLENGYYSKERDENKGNVEIIFHTALRKGDFINSSIF